MKIKKGDFIEIDFVASTSDGSVFDTTREEEAKKAGLITDENKQEFKSLRVCVGEGMVVKGLDNAFEDKEPGEYEINLKPSEAFGKRNPGLIKTVSLSSFEQPPQAGMFVNVNGMVARVVSVSGGRALIDLNNPLAGKEVHYKFKINNIIKEATEKIKILAERFPFEINNVEVKDKKAVLEIKEKEKIDEKIFDKFKEKVKSLVSLDCELKNN